MGSAATTATATGVHMHGRMIAIAKTCPRPSANNYDYNLIIVNCLHYLARNLLSSADKNYV